MKFEHMSCGDLIWIDGQLFHTVNSTPEIPPFNVYIDLNPKNDVYLHALGVLPNGTSAQISYAQAFMNKYIVDPLLLLNGTDYLISSTWSTYSSFDEH